MRFMIMHKVTPETDTGLPPSPEVLDEINQLVDAAVRQGSLVSGEGLKPTSERVHLKYENGRRTMTPGPFADPRELVGGFGLFRVRSRDEAIEWCDKLAQALGDVELYLGPVVEPWDFGAPKPADAPLRFLSVHRMDAAAERGEPPAPEVVERMGALLEEATKAGVLQAAAGLAPTSTGARVRWQGGTRTVIDGPFAESKELVAGFAILDLPSKAAALDWAIRFGEIVRVNEVELREVAQ
jgi:hypothetical protein